MSPRIRLVLVSLGVVLLVWAAATFLVSDETRIRRLIAGALDDFADGDKSCVDALAEDFVEASTRATPPIIRQYLTAIFIQQQNRADGGFRYPAEISPDSLRIDVPESGATAAVEATLEFIDRRAEVRTVRWTLKVSGDLQKTEGDWQLHRARIETLSGGPPF